MTPIPTSYLFRDLYRQAWEEPESLPCPAAPPSRDGERPWWRTGPARLGGALEGLAAGWGRPARGWTGLAG